MKPRTLPLYQLLAELLQARANCAKSGNVEWHERHEEKAARLVEDFMPSGSGFDSGTELDMDASTAEKLVFRTSYHHMDGESGMYDGWTDHTIIVRPSLSSGFKLTISGRDRNQFKDYAHELFYFALSDNVCQHDDGTFTREVSK